MANPTANEALYDLLVDNAATSRLYEATVQRDVKRIIRRHKEKLGKLTKQSLNKREIQKEINRFVAEVSTITGDHLTEFGASQLSFHENALHKVVGHVTNVASPKLSPELAEIVGMNIGGNRSIEKSFKSIGANEWKRIDNIINRGLSKKLTTPEISAQIARTVNITENQATTLVRTAITRSTNAAQASVMDANADLLNGYQYVAILDARTSEICSYHDGRIYPISDKQHVPPLHWNCRSTIVPLPKSYDELLGTQSRQVRKTVLKELSPQARAELDGRAFKKESYGQWLRRQAYEVKLKHFGGDDEKVGLFDNGLLEVKQFFTPKGKGVSIQRLRQWQRSVTTVFTQRRAIAGTPDIPVKATNPRVLMKDKKLTDDLRDFYITEASTQNTALSVVDYKGTSLAGKRQSRRAASSGFDDARTQFIDPITGDVKNSYLYDPDFNTFQERLDFLRASKVLKDQHKDYIEEFVLSLNDKVSINQQSAVLENLRINFERYLDPQRPSYRQDWENFEAVIRAEMPNSVVNVSRILDRRSRAAAERFSLMGGKTGEAAIQIDGRWTSFDDLAKDYNDNLRYIRNWRKRDGRALARDAFYRGRAPLRTYFLKPVKKPKKLSKRFKDWIKKQPGGARALKMIEGRPQKSITQEFIDSIIDTVTLGKQRRALLETELTIKALYAKAREAFLRNDYDDKLLDVIAEAFELVATGTSTDYDTIAINMGKLLYKKHPFDVPLRNHILGEPSIEMYHKQGSSLLQRLEERGMIRVTPRGVTRRAVIDVDTGRPDGSWRDTVSREVTVLDKELRQIQIARRKIYVTERIGIIDKGNELEIDLDTKRYKTRRGQDTGESVVTRRASVYYDTIQMDKNLVDEINWANSMRWRVDDEYAGFMLDLARFRDPRGNVQKYDELNGVRQIVLQRGDQGLGLMQTVKWHKDRGKAFTNAHQIDSRGRIYARGYLTPTGGEFVRPFLNTADAKALGVDGWIALREQIGALIGPAQESLTNRGRFAIVQRHHKELLELGEQLQATTQRDRRIRAVLEHPLVRSLDAEEHPKLLRLALEYKRIYDHTGGNLNDLEAIAKYKTQLALEIDASASGAQIIALSTKNRALAIESNVLATPQKNRLYDIMAQDAISDPRFKALGRLPSDLTWEDLSKAAKAQNMVAFYGAGQATQSANLANKLAKELIDRDFIVVTRRRDRATPKEAFVQLDLNKIVDNAISDAVRIGADDTVRDLRLLKKELNDVIDNSAPIGSHLRSMASDLHPDVEDFVNKVSGTHAGIVGPNEFKTISQIMSERLAQRAPVTETYIQFWKGVAERYMTETKSTDIPTIMFDGKKITQRYRPVLEQRIEYRDPTTGRRVRNIYRGTVEDAKLKGRASIVDARTGLGVNLNHSQDATIVRQFHLWGRRNKVPTATIHDAFFVNAGDAMRAKGALRRIYADTLDADIVRDTLKEMRRSGMTRASYLEFIKEAERLGLIPDKRDALRREEVLAPLKDDEYWYGIGP